MTHQVAVPDMTDSDSDGYDCDCKQYTSLNKTTQKYTLTGS